jgi:hypothetical protein
MGARYPFDNSIRASICVTVLVLDSGGLSTLATSSARLIALREEGLWPPEVPTAVLAEALTGDHRRDFHVNRLLKACQVRDVTQLVARSAAQLRTQTGRAGDISAVDAIVVAHAADLHQPAVVLTSDPTDIRDLAAVSAQTVTVIPMSSRKR